MAKQDPDDNGIIRSTLHPNDVVYRQCPPSSHVSFKFWLHSIIVQYKDENEINLVMKLIDNELSEPYSIFTYRYFLRQWPNLCFLAFDSNRASHCFGCVVAKMDVHRNRVLRGYIGMLTVEKEYRHLGVGSELVRRVLSEMVDRGCEEVMLEAEVTNIGALKLYSNFGFIRDKRLQRYYLNGNDAFRLKLLLPRKMEPGGDDVLQAADNLHQLRIGQEDNATET